MKKLIIILLCLFTLSAVLPVQTAYSWYSDCNATSARDTSFTNPGSAFPSGGEQNCGIVLFRVKKEMGKPADAEVLKGNFNEVLKDAPKKPVKELDAEVK
ncbi:MAG: hypothetical protein H7843_06420 [Nitrospirota bacterium]